MMSGWSAQVIPENPLMSFFSSNSLIRQPHVKNRDNSTIMVPETPQSAQIIPNTPLMSFPSSNSLAQSHARNTENNNTISVPETPTHPQFEGGRECCNKESLLHSVAYINQDLELLGLPCVPVDSLQNGDLDPIALLNRLTDVLSLYHKTLAVKDELELRNHRLSCDLEHHQSSYKRLKRTKEQVEREANQEREKFRQLNCKYKSMSSQIKADEEELRKLTAAQSSRDLQYKHEQKKKEKELNKLKERLHQLIADKAPDRKVGMDIMSLVGGSDGRRATWKTAPVKQEEEMYQVLVNNYEESRQELMQENAELRDCLLSLQRELSTLLKRTGDMNTSTSTELSNHVNMFNSSMDEDEEEDSSQRCPRLSITDLDDGYFQMPCDIMRNQIQQMFKDTCDQISHSMKKSLVRNLSKSSSSSRRLSQSSFSNLSEKAISERRNSVVESSEIERLKKQIQNYKSIIEHQEDLIQQTLSSHSHSMENTFYHESQLHKEKENLSEQRNLFAEERANFDKERKSFTEAAIRLAKEKKSFDAEKAALLKQQFLNLSPFKGNDSKKGKGDGSSNRLLPATPVFSPAKSDPRLATDLPTTAELFKALGLTKNTRVLPSSEEPRQSSSSSAIGAFSAKTSSHSQPAETLTPSVPPPSGTQDYGGSGGSSITRRISASPRDSVGTPSPTAVTSTTCSPRVEAIKASLMKKHLERSQSKD